ncbi:MAG TPA: ADOP family duplicated permease [Candidatus Limnocylindrales bacterium]|nr:ADOP family duplicated permease [Candidatus Limnocylindrales bacterium]
MLPRHKHYDDLSEEIRGHIGERVEDLVAEGLSREDAETAARREFGNTTLLQERGREVWQWNMSENLLRDMKLAIRQLRRNPGFTFTVLVTLALAVGANTAVFSLVNVLLVRPLPYTEPQRLAAVVRNLKGVNPSGQVVDDTEDGQDGETWELIRDHVSAAQFAAEYHGADGVNLEAGNQARYVLDHRVSASYFDVLGIKPLLGRGFTQEEDSPHGPNAVILSHETWKSLFGSDREIIGRAIRLKGEPYTIVGVMPPNLQTTAVADLWTPLRPWRGGEGGGDNYRVLVRLRDGATWAELNAQLAPIHPEMFDNFFKGASLRLLSRPLQQDLADEKRAPTLMLMAAVGLILLIACINIAGLMLVRLYRRDNEMATRLALGATRLSILRQIFMEPLLLTLAGSAAGVALAYLSLRSFVSLFPEDMLPVGSINIDGRVLLFSSVVGVISGLMIGIFPAIASNRFETRPSLCGKASASSPQSTRTRYILIACEVCLTVVLLAGAGMLVRTLVYLRTLPPGFDSQNVTVAKASLDDARFRDPAAFQKLLQASLNSMRRIPGVDSAAVGLGLPYERGLNDGFKIADGPTAGTSMVSSASYVTPDYFRALRIPVLAGRAFTQEDTADTPHVAIVNAAFARKFFRSVDVIGRHLQFGKDLCTVVGVVGDVTKQPGISITAPLATEPVYYVPATQVSGPFLALIHTWFQPSWIVRTQGPISGLSEQMQSALQEAAPNLPFSAFHQMSDLQAKALGQQRVEVVLLIGLAALALLLAVVGIYGLVSNLIAQRRREIGIRMALGCTVVQAMIASGRTGLTATCIGMAAGAGAAAIALRAMNTQLFGVRSLDPATLGAVCVLLLVAACFASFAPTLRIARINPSATLRSE